MSRAALMLLAMAAPLVSADVAAQGMVLPEFERIELENGAIILLHEKHDVPLVGVEVIIRGGASLPDDQELAKKSSILFCGSPAKIIPGDTIGFKERWPTWVMRSLTKPWETFLKTTASNPPRLEGARWIGPRF